MPATFRWAQHVRLQCSDFHQDLLTYLAEVVFHPVDEDKLS